MPDDLELHRHLRVEALRLLVHRLPRLEVDAAHVRDLLERREERRRLGLGGQHLVQLLLPCCWRAARSSWSLNVASPARCLRRRARSRAGASCAFGRRRSSPTTSRVEDDPVDDAKTSTTKTAPTPTLRRRRELAERRAAAPLAPSVPHLRAELELHQLELRVLVDSSPSRAAASRRRSSRSAPRRRTNSETSSPSRASPSIFTLAIASLYLVSQSRRGSQFGFGHGRRVVAFQLLELVVIDGRPAARREDVRELEQHRRRTGARRLQLRDRLLAIAQLVELRLDLSGARRCPFLMLSICACEPALSARELASARSCFDACKRTSADDLEQHARARRRRATPGFASPQRRAPRRLFALRE